MSTLRLGIGIDTHKGSLKGSVEEICDSYELTLVEDAPIIDFKNESRAIFFAEITSEKMENIDALQADIQVLEVWLDPIITYTLSDERPKSLINRLDDIFKNS